MYSKLFTNDRLYIYAYRTCVKYRIIKYIQREVFSMNLLLVQLVWFLLNFQNYSLIKLKKNKVGVWIGRFKMLLLSMGFKVFMEWQESQCMLRLFDVNVNTCTFNFKLQKNDTQGLNKRIFYINFYYLSTFHQLHKHSHRQWKKLK